MIFIYIRVVFSKVFKTIIYNLNLNLNLKKKYKFFKNEIILVHITFVFNFKNLKIVFDLFYYPNNTE